MEQNLPKFVKHVILPAFFLLLSGLLLFPAILNASKQVNSNDADIASDYLLFLPIIYNQGDGQTPINTPTNTPTLTPLPSNTPTRAAQQQEILFVVGNVALNNGDTAVYDHLINDGYNLVVKDSSVQLSDANGKALIIISSTSNPGSIGAKFQDIDIPVLLWNPYLYDDMGMTSSSSNDRGIDTSETNLSIRNQNHPLAAGLSNHLHSVTNSNQTFTWGNPANTAYKIAITDSNNSRYATIFGYELGKMMQPGKVAPARRVGFFLHDDTAAYLNDTGWQLFDAAISWLLAPPIPPIPTAGPTPSTTASHTPTPVIPTVTPTSTSTPELPTVTPTTTSTPHPTNTSTPTIYPTATETRGPTATSSPTATRVICNVQFDGFVIEGAYSVFVTGDVGTTINIIRNGQVLGSATLIERDGHACEGFAEIPLNAAVHQGDFLIAESNDGSVDSTIVLATFPTATQTSTHTPAPTNTPTHTPTPPPTPTPSYPYIALFPNCGTEPNMEITVAGYNWDNDESIAFYWEGNPEVFAIIPEGHDGGFAFTATFTKPDGTHTMRAESSGSGAEKDISTANFYVPCPGTEYPTATPTVTSTPVPADLIIGQPQLLSTPDIVAHTPLEFTVNITNNGEVDINEQFFVDIYLDPQTIFTDSIPLDESDGYIAVSSLAGGESKQLTLSAPAGFENTPDPHSVYGMVDSVQQVVEESETNNVSSALSVPDVTPAAPPLPTATPDGSQQVSGVVNVVTNDILPQFRALVQLVHPTDGVIAYAQTDFNGFYIFNNIAPLPDSQQYTVTACVKIDTGSYFGIRSGIQPPYPYADVYMLSGPCS